MPMFTTVILAKSNCPIISLFSLLKGPPKIRKKKSYNYAVLDEPGHMECVVESVPPPIAITWSHNGQVRKF